MLKKTKLITIIIHIVNSKYTISCVIQLYSKKSTRQYFNVRDDDLSSKQGSLCKFKVILIKITHKYSKVYINILIFVIKLKHNINIFMWEFDR